MNTTVQIDAVQVISVQFAAVIPHKFRLYRTYATKFESLRRPVLRRMGAHQL